MSWDLYTPIFLITPPFAYAVFLLTVFFGLVALKTWAFYYILAPFVMLFIIDHIRFFQKRSLLISVLIIFLLFQFIPLPRSSYQSDPISGPVEKQPFSIGFGIPFSIVKLSNENLCSGSGFWEECQAEVATSRVLIAASSKTDDVSTRNISGAVYLLGILHNISSLWVIIPSVLLIRFNEKLRKKKKNKKSSLATKNSSKS